MTTSRFLFKGNLNSTFNTKSETNRNKRRTNIVPTHFYRPFFETSITLSANVSKDTHTKHREQPDLEIMKGNAFQAVGPFAIRESLDRERIERHLIWNKKKPQAHTSPPSTNSVSQALRQSSNR
jgi:hypothetical protein